MEIDIALQRVIKVAIAFALFAAVSRPALADMLASGDEAGQWRGAAIDAGLKKEGAASAVWAPARADALHLENLPSDWTKWNTLRFHMHNNVATDTYVQFIIQSEDTSKDGMDYWTARIPLDFTGWRTFTWALKDLARIREPIGWHKITHLYFSATYGGNQPDPRTRIHIDAFEVFHAEPPKGPRTTDAELFEALDPAVEALAPALAAAGRGDMAQARKSLCDYLRRRAARTWHFTAQSPPEASYKKAVADAAVEDRFTVVTYTHQFPKGKIDWGFNATADRKDVDINYEWQWQLGRMHYWNDMARAYTDTGDARYARAWARQLRSWVHDCPVPASAKNGTYSSWRTIEAGIRMFGAWPEAFHRFVASPHVPDDAIVDYVKSSLEHARYLKRFHVDSGNWLGLEMRGLHVTGCVFPEFKEAASWRRYAIDTLGRQLEAQFLPDGAQGELTPGYGYSMLSNCLSPLEFSRTVGRLDEVPDNFADRAEKGFDYFMHIATPNRNVPQFNDTWPLGIVHVMSKGMELFPQRQDFAWMATQGEKGSPPETTSIDLRYSGHFIMRSGWGREANYLAFDNGPLGAGHVHQDKLNVVIYPYGRQLLYDNGGGSYERGKWRAYSIDTYSHNTVLFDGMPQRRIDGSWSSMPREPAKGRWESTDACDFTEGAYDGPYSKESVGNLRNAKTLPRPAIHHRRILFVKPDVFIVADNLMAKDDKPHQWQARWHLLTTAMRHDDATGAVETADGGKPNLVVVPVFQEGLDVRVDSGKTEPEILGWDNSKYRNPKPATTIRHMLGGSGQQLIATLFVPLRPGEKSPVAKVESAGRGQARVHLDDGRVWTVAVSEDVNGAMGFVETLPNGSQGRNVSGGDSR